MGGMSSSRLRADDILVLSDQGSWPETKLEMRIGILKADLLMASLIVVALQFVTLQHKTDLKSHY
jgi:hypothetical protein